MPEVSGLVTTFGGGENALGGRSSADPPGRDLQVLVGFGGFTKWPAYVIVSENRPL